MQTNVTEVLYCVTLYQPYLSCFNYRMNNNSFNHILVLCLLLFHVWIIVTILLFYVRNCHLEAATLLLVPTSLTVSFISFSLLCFSWLLCFHMCIIHYYALNIVKSLVNVFPFMKKCYINMVYNNNYVIVSLFYI